MKQPLRFTTLGKSVNIGGLGGAKLSEDNQIIVSENSSKMGGELMKHNNGFL